MFAPHVDQKEALSLMVKHFIESVKSGKEPISSGKSGLNVVRILEAAELSLKSGGQQIQFSRDYRTAPVLSESIAMNMAPRDQNSPHVPVPEKQAEHAHE